MRQNRFYAVPLILALVVGVIAAKRHSRRTEQRLEEWQKRYLEKIQLLAREGGLSEEDWKGITKFDEDVCYTRECLESALEIMEATNFTVDPCKPSMWLSFVCLRRVNGSDNINQLERLMKNVEHETKFLLEDESGASDDEFLLKEAQTYYKQCKNKGGGEFVKEILNYASENYGEWPMMSNRDPSPTFDWLNMVADLNRIERVGFTPLFLKVVMDHTDPQIQVKVGQTSLPLATDYVKLITRIQKASGKERPIRVDQFRSMKQFVDSTSYATMRSTSSPSYTIKELQEKTDEYFKKNDVTNFQLNWKKFFQRVLNGSDIKITSSSPNVTLPFEQVMGIMQTIDHAIGRNDTKPLANALHFQLVTLLLQESTTLADDLNSFKCTEQSGTREEIYARTTEIFGYSLGKTYLNTFYDEEKNTPAIRALMEKIQQGYTDVIDDTKWMEQETKEYLKDKVLSMKTFIAEPDWTKNSDELQKFYEDLRASSDPESSSPLNYLAITTWALMKKYSWGYKLANLASLSDFHIYDMEWSRYLGNVQAQYHKMINEARIEGGIVKSPIFDSSRPGFMNFGGLGMVLAHEIGHSYDTQGREYNKNGEKGEFWDPESVKRYKMWINRVAQDYGSVAHQISETSAETIDPYKTLNEDISDILAIYISYKSYEEYLKQLKADGESEKILPGLKKFEPEKLFYMKYANMWCDKKDVQDRFNDLLSSHSSGSTRATLPLKRSREFAETFGCPIPEQF